MVAEASLNCEKFSDEQRGKTNQYNLYLMANPEETPLTVSN